MLKGARALDIVTFEGRSEGGRISIKITGRMREYKVVHLLEYTSERKRMSVVATPVVDDANDHASLIATMTCYCCVRVLIAPSLHFFFLKSEGDQARENAHLARRHNIN